MEVEENGKPQSKGWGCIFLREALPEVKGEIGWNSNWEEGKCNA